MQEWETACALEDRCPECGTDFLWRDVLAPGWSTPRWLIESRSAGPPFVRAYVKTLLRSLVLWRFWRQVQPNHEVRFSRLGVYLAVSFALYHVIYVACTASIARWLWLDSVWVVDRSMMGAARYFVDDAGFWPRLVALPYFVRHDLPRGPSWTSHLSIGFPEAHPLLIAAIAMGLLMLVLGESLRHLKLRSAHLIRATMYSIPLVLGLHALTFIARTLIVHVHESLMVPPSISQSRFVMQAVAHINGPALVMLLPIGLTLGLLCAWWWRFFASYAQMRHALVTPIVMLVPAILFTWIMLWHIHSS